MPELPEVETMCRGIHSILGKRIARVEFCRCRLKPMSIEPSRSVVRKRLVGAVVRQIGRLGKRVVIELENDWVHIFEPRMTGLVLTSDPPNRTHMRVAWHFDESGDRLLFWDRRGLGKIAMMPKERVTQKWGPDVLGPDALTIPGDHLRTTLSQSRRAIKVALLDQSVVAGIGNLYASEILHVAKVHPDVKCERLTRRQWQRIENAVPKVLEEAVFYEGSTLSDGTYRNALNQTGSYQNHHRVYARDGLPCPACSAPIQRMVQAQRSTFWCPVCQAKSAA